MHFAYTLAALAAGASAAPKLLDPRQYTIPPRPDDKTYDLVGDGSPRQAYLYEQVTPVGQCGREGESCTMTNVEVETSTITWTVGATDPLGFISAGFSVSESKSRGFSASCGAGAGDSDSTAVCVWARIAHTGYEVQGWKHRQGTSASSGSKEGDATYIWAPNDSAGHGYVCGHGNECGDEGDQWWGYKSEGDALWESDTNAVGPSSFVWDIENPDHRWY